MGVRVLLPGYYLQEAGLGNGAETQIRCCDKEHNMLKSILSAVLNALGCS